MVSRHDVAASVFALTVASKFNEPSDIQTEALHVIHDRKVEPPASGIVVLPCGTGKTMIFLKAALCAGSRVLFLCYEKQGVVQVANAIREHTTVPDSHLCVYTSDAKTEPNPLGCFMVTTYGMFTNRSGHQSEQTTRIKEFVLHNDWDLVVCDEVHHAAAATYRPLIEQLKTTATRILGFTGTLCRLELPPEQEARVKSGAVTRDAAMEAHFEFVGPVLYSQTCKTLEADGLIAKLRLMEVRTPMTTEFQTAHEMAAGTLKKYVESLHPNKLRIVWAIVQMHRSIGEIGMIFVDHLLHGKVLKAMLGDRWEILAGGNAHGTEGTHTIAANAEIVDRFNARKLDGIIATPVGESSLDVCHDDFRFAIVLDAHSGPAAASQKLGRLSRTSRLPPVPNHTAAQQRARRLACQKQAAYYELVTSDTEEEHAAAVRREQFCSEGYEVRPMEHDRLLAMAKKTNPPPCIYEDDAPCLRLLIDVLSYRALGEWETEARAESKAQTEPHRKEITRLKQKASTSKTSVMKERLLKKAKKLDKQAVAMKTIAKEERIAQMSGCILSATAWKVVQELKISEERLEEIGVALPKETKDEDDDDESQ